MNGYPYIVDVLREFVGRPFLLAVQCREVERVDGMAVECSLVSFDHGIMTVNSHRPMIMRLRKQISADGAPSRGSRV